MNSEFSPPMQGSRGLSQALRPRGRVLHGDLAGAFVIACAVVLARLPGFPASSLDWDEACYVLMAREILAGHLPYVTMFLEKPPGAPALVAVAMELFGRNLVSVRLLGLLSVLATSLILRTAARSAGVSRHATLAASVLYAIYSTQSGGLGTNIEILVSPFTSAAVLFMLRAHSATAARARLQLVVAAGALFGAAIQLKYLPAIPAAAVFCSVFGRLLLSGTIRLREAAVSGAAFATVCWLPTTAAIALYWWRGHLDIFMLANFGFMSSYVGVKQSTDVVQLEIVRQVLALAPLLLPALTAGLWRKDTRPGVMVMTIWLGAEVAALIAPWKFWDHYFLLLLPPLCLLTAFAIDGLSCVLAARRTETASDARLIAVRTIAAAIALTPTVGLGTQIVRGNLDIRQPDIVRQVSVILRDDGGPGATAWVVNYQPVVYFLADVPLPTRFPFPPSLVGAYSGYNGSQPEAEVRRILAARPTFLVLSQYQELIKPSLRAIVEDAAAHDYRLYRSVGEGVRRIDLYRRIDRSAGPYGIDESSASQAR